MLVGNKSKLLLFASSTSGSDSRACLPNAHSCAGWEAQFRSTSSIPVRAAIPATVDLQLADYSEVAHLNDTGLSPFL